MTLTKLLLLLLMMMKMIMIRMMVIIINCYTTYSTTTHLRFRTVERKPDISFSDSSLQVAAAASQTDEHVTGGEHLFHTSFREMLYHFLVHTIDVKRGNLVDKLVTKDVLSSGESKK